MVGSAGEAVGRAWAVDTISSVRYPTVLFDLDGTLVDSGWVILAQGRGCILLGSHLGSFEALRALARHVTRHPVNIVMHEGVTPLSSKQPSSPGASTGSELKSII